MLTDDVLVLDGRRGETQGFLRTGDTHCGHDNLVKQVYVRGEYHIHARRCGKHLVFHTDVGEYERCSCRYIAQRESTVSIGNCAVGRTLHEHGGTDDWQSVFCGSDDSGDRALSKCNPHSQEEEQECNK